MIHEPNINLIVKSLTGNLGIKEEELFQDWLLESESNRLYYEKLRIIWERTDESYRSVKFNEFVAREKIRRNVQQLHSRKINLKARIWITSAASILFLLGLGFLFNPILDSHRNNQVVYSSGNQVREIFLPDSSHIWLNENSTLQVPKAFSGNSRRVKLEGEAFFQVARNETMPFKIKAGKTIIKVLGTSFDIEAEKESGDVSVVVNTGRVAFFKTNSLQNNYILTPDTKGFYRATDKKITISANTDRNYLSWKTGLLTFYDTPIDEVCAALSEFYKHKVISSLGDKSLSLTGSFQDEPLEDILNTIQLTLDVQITQSDEEILIHK